MQKNLKKDMANRFKKLKKILKEKSQNIINNMSFETFSGQNKSSITKR